MILIENGIKKCGNLVLDIDHLEIPQGLVTVIVGKKFGLTSTLLKLLSGAVKLDSGEISIDEVSIEMYQKKRGIFYIPKKAVGRSDMSVFRNINIFEELISNFDSRKFERYLTSSGIPLNLKLEELSEGQQRRYMLELYKMTNDPLLLLDEPTTGMDEDSKKFLMTMIQEHLINENNYVIIASDSSEDIESMSDHIIYLKDGKVFFKGSAAEMQERYRLWRGIEDDMPELGVVGIKKKPGLIEVLVDTYKNSDETLERLEFHDLLKMLERSSQ